MHRTALLSAFALATTLAVAPPTAAAPPAPQDPALPRDLALARIFGDGMVLQQQASIPIRGYAAPHAAVTVRTSWGATVEAVADAWGHWRAMLETPAAGDPVRITVEAGEESVTLEDVLLGEVWLCSGQSNMEWPVRKSILRAREESGLPEDVLTLERPRIRYFNVPNVADTEPRSDLGGGTWRAVDGTEGLECTAVGYFFAVALEDALDVPIGLVDASWGGTPAESWTPHDAVVAFPRHAAVLRNLEGRERNEMALAKQWAGELADCASSAPKTPGAAASSPATDPGPPPSYTAAGFGEHDGAAWYHVRFEVPADFDTTDAVLRLPAFDDLDVTWLDDAIVGVTLETDAWARRRDYPLPTGAIAPGAHTLTVLCIDTGGLGGPNGDLAVRIDAAGGTLDLPAAFQVVRGPSLEELPPVPVRRRLDAHTPAALWNGMIAPLLPFTFRGVLWYQGEANKDEPHHYRELFASMIGAWRAELGVPELPFFFAQIAPWNYGDSTQDDDDLGELRLAQADALALPATGMAVTADVGNPKDIHPRNKWAVGARMALQARAKVYGEEGLDPEPPTAVRAVPQGAALRVEFAHTGGALRASGDLDHFQISGDGHAYHPATARIVDGGVTLSSPFVEAPRAARYLWSDDAAATLFGAQGLPAAPFRITADE